MFVIETIMPDGPHWYGGIRRRQKDQALVQGPEWTPYWEDARKMSMAEADLIFETVCQSMPGSVITPVDKALAKDAWVFIPAENGNPPSWSIRAKYMSKGLIVKIPNLSGQYRVMDRTEKEFRLHSCQTSGKLTDASGQTRTIGVKSSMRVTVIGAKSEVSL